MIWLRQRMCHRSECGRYEIRPDYRDGHFAYRARLVETDELIASSADLTYVQLTCERHVEELLMEEA